LSSQCFDLSRDVWAEFWISLSSLLRSYTAAHGLHRNSHATVELDEDRILVCHGDRCLELMRTGPEVNWKREDGSNGVLQFTSAGRLSGPSGEEEMDMAAETWARELMQ
jgi:hypothetical protein